MNHSRGQLKYFDESVKSDKIVISHLLRFRFQGDQLAALDRTILDNWIQLRSDYKSERLGNYL